jgi:hypothetical protein
VALGLRQWGIIGHSASRAIGSMILRE